MKSSLGVKVVARWDTSKLTLIKAYAILNYILRNFLIIRKKALSDYSISNIIACLEIYHMKPRDL